MKNFVSARYKAGSEHGIPGGEGHGFLLQDVEHLCRSVFLIDHEAEHVFVKPAVGHYQVAVVGAGSPAVLHHLSLIHI